MKLIEKFDPSLAQNGIINTNGPNKDEQLMLYNDSPIGMRLDFPDGSYGVIPPAWNKDFILKNVPMDKVKWSFYNQLAANSWPISQVYGEIHEPGEHVASVNAAMQRGTTSTGGSVATVGTTLSNEAAAVPTKIIDIGNATINDLIDIFNDGDFIWKVMIAGVAHQLMKGQTAGNPLQLGQAGDITELLGQLLIDQVPTATAAPPSGTGSISIYEMAFGPIKIAVVFHNNFKNTGAQFTLGIPTPFTAGAVIVAGGCTQIELLSAGVAQSCAIVTTLVAGNTSNTTPETVIFSWNYGATNHAFDTLRFQANNAGTHPNDILVLIGV